jgi:hypothetical protein
MAPAFLATECHLTFCRIALLVTPPRTPQLSLLWFHARFASPLFVTLGMLSACIEFAGAVIVGVACFHPEHDSSYDLNDIGLHVLQVGLAIQLGVLGTFALVGIRFAFVSYRWINEPQPFSARSGANWHGLLWTINLASIALVVRCPGRFNVAMDCQSLTISRAALAFAFSSHSTLCTVIMLNSLSGHFGSSTRAQC